MMFVFFLTENLTAQYLNKEIAAKILIEESSEFYTLKATVENITLADRSLQFEFISFRKDIEENTIKDVDEARFVLLANEKKILAEKTINASEQARVIFVLVIYDKDRKPLGQDRVVFNDTPEDNQQKATVNGTALEKPVTVSNNDMAAPQDGFFMEGLVIENSLTKIGRDFYTLFYSKYYLSGLKSAKNIVIDEIPGRGRNTRITIKVDDQLVWQFFSNPRREFLQEQADITFRRVLAKLQEMQKTQESITRY